MPAFPDMRLVTAPLPTRLVFVKMIGHRTGIALNSIAGKRAVITRDEDERVVSFACPFQRIHHLSYHPINEPNQIAARPGTTLSACEVWHDCLRARFMRCRRREIEKEGGIRIGLFFNVFHRLLRDNGIGVFMLPTGCHHAGTTCKLWDFMIDAGAFHKRVVLDEAVGRLAGGASGVAVEIVKA